MQNVRLLDTSECCDLHNADVLSTDTVLAVKTLPTKSDID